MAEIDLGKLKVQNRGEWSSGTAYEKDDFVQFTDSGVISTYIAVANSTGQTPSSGGIENSSFWKYMAKGTATEKMAHGPARTINFAATSENAYQVDTTNGVITVTFPPSPAVGDQIMISDYRGTFSINPVTINRNGQKIEGNADDWCLSQKGTVVTFTFDSGISGDEGWRVTHFTCDYDFKYGGQTKRGAASKTIGSKKYLIATSDAEEIYTDGNDIVHKFLTSGTFTVNSLGSDSVLGDKIEYLIVGGGGSGGMHHAAGGGAGGYRNNNALDHTITAQDYTITVGTGGSSRTGNGGGNDGGASVAFGLTSAGGGGGGNSQTRGRDGGSGGGSQHSHTHGNANGQGTGNRGGNHESHTGGGGGGAGGRGADQYGHREGGHGGNGLQTDITGELKYYAGGGGSCGHDHTSAGDGGVGGGGTGMGGSGLDGFGGGGGGTDGTGGGARHSGRGGSGIVVVRYRGRD